MANVVINDNSLKAIGNAIRIKNGKGDLYTPAEMAPAIEAIETGGGGGGEVLNLPPKEINFYDFRGNIVVAWSLNELKDKVTLPEYPLNESKEDLVFDGWNWTLEKLKALNAPVDVGANYDTPDKKTWIYLNIPRDGKAHSYYLGNHTSTFKVHMKIDWGDGSPIYEGASSNLTNVKHDYPVNVGPVIIKIENYSPYEGFSISPCRAWGTRLLVEKFDNNSYKALNGSEIMDDYPREIASCSQIKRIHFGSNGCVAVYKAPYEITRDKNFLRLFDDLILEDLTFPNKINICNTSGQISQSSPVYTSINTRDNTVRFSLNGSFNFPQNIGYMEFNSTSMYFSNVLKFCLGEDFQFLQYSEGGYYRLYGSSQKKYPDNFHCYGKNPAGGAKAPSIVLSSNLRTHFKRLLIHPGVISSIGIPYDIDNKEVWLLKGITGVSFYNAKNCFANVKSIYIKEDSQVIQLDNSVFGLSFQSLQHIYVPSNLVEQYKVATNWSTKADIIEAEPEVYVDDN